MLQKICLNCNRPYTTKHCLCTSYNRKSEWKLGCWLQDNNFEYIQEYNSRKIKKNTNFYYDFYLPNYNIIIELDGEQHFYAVSNIDIRKMKYANRAGISIIRIPQLFVKEDTNQWEEILLSKIKKYKYPKVVYIGKWKYKNMKKKYSKCINILHYILYKKVDYYDTLSYNELKEIACNKGIIKYYKMDKKQLIQKLKLINNV